MKQTKREFILYSFYDHTSIARHLETMALKGWRLEKIRTNGVWIYRRAEPRALHYAVTYLPQASDYEDVEKAQEEFLSLCAAAGWHLAAQTFQMLILYSEAEDPVPLDTDPAIQVANLHEAMCAGYIWGNVLMLAVAFFVLLRIAAKLEQGAIFVLSSPLILLLACLLILLVLYSGGELAAYLLWYKKALRMAEEEGRFLPTRGGRWKDVLLCLSVTALLTALLVCGEWRAWISIVFFTVGVGLCQRIGGAFRDRLKRAGKSGAFNRGATFLLLLLLIILLQHGQDRLSEVFAREDHEEVTYSYLGKEYTAYCDPLPLTLGSLTGVDDSHYSSRLYARSTVLASILSGSQICRQDVSGAPYSQFYYHLYRSPLSFPLDDSVCWSPRYVELSILQDPAADSQLTDPTPFGAEEAWFRRHNGCREYLLRFESCVIQLSFGWEPSQEQVTQALNTLLAL